jgi:ATP-dependent DNA helicase RecG
MTSANKIADTKKDDLIIGTHALIQKGVEFHNLGLIIIDEQHRFGVKQRAYLRRQKTVNGQRSTDNIIPHLLSMTATPIPRTLALALYGDLDISIIDEMPEGRQKIETRVVAPTDREKAYDFIENEIKKGRQAFVICPLIEQKADTMVNLFETDRKSAVAEYEKLSQKIFPNLKIGLMHGKLKSKEKDEVMQKFKDKKIDILVSTAVVEVGIDIPNATVMMIEDADRFGLAQLHQFRGRVGRGEHQSFCFLFSNSDSAKNHERLNAMSRSNNGFELAQIDLQLRGSGEIVGLKQSGLQDLKMANLSDTMLIGEARQAAQKIVEEGIEKYPALCEKLKEFEVERHLE